MDSGVDLLLAPTAPGLPWALSEEMEPLDLYLSDAMTVLASLADIPAVSVPTGSVSGLPVGLQLMAPRRQEAPLLRAAAALEWFSPYETRTSWPWGDGRLGGRA